MFSDKTIVCKIAEPATFTASEQEFYAEKGFTNEPQRCKNCRTARKQSSPTVVAAATVRCMTRFCTKAAASPAKFPSFVPTVLFIAATASASN